MGSRRRVAVVVSTLAQELTVLVVKLLTRSVEYTVSVKSDPNEAN